MSGGVDIIRSLLAADTPVLTALGGSQPEKRIGAGVLPGNTTLPAIGLALISAFDRNLPNAGAKVFVTQRVQVTVLATDYVQQEAVLKAVRAACRDKSGLIAGYAGSAVITDGTGPDFRFGTGPGIYVKAQDFRVTFSETP